MADKSLAAFPVWSDLRTFDGEPWRGKVDILAGGIPCQPWSIAGKRRGASDERHLWPDAARIIAEVEPGVVFIENVGGFVSGALELVCDELRQMDYRATAGLFTAEEVGAPHRRERCFVMGVAGGGVADAARQRPQGEHGQTSKSRAVRRSRKAVADDDDNAWGRRDAQRRSQRRADAYRPGENGFRIFPPGPSDLDAWREILAERPDLAPAVEPCVCGVVDGAAGRLGGVSASRSAQLRALGNGVVPHTAAVAFATLWACLCEN